MSQYQGRRSLWWLTVPYVLFVLAIPFVNRVDPVVLGLPFLFFWVLIGVLVSPLAIWLASRGDRQYASNEPEATDVD
jgi:Protein of unknown function (DUF3311)